MIRIQYDVFVSHYYDFDDYTDLILVVVMMMMLIQ